MCSKICGYLREEQSRQVFVQVSWAISKRSLWATLVFQSVQSCLIGQRKLTPLNQADSLRLYNLTSHWLLLNSSNFFLFLLSFSKYAEAKLCAKNETLKSCKVTPQLQDDVDFIYDEFNPFCSERKDPQGRILRKKPSSKTRRSPVQDVEEKIRPSRGKKISSKVSILVATLCSVLSIVS